MHSILQFLRRILPKPVLTAYHRLLSLAAGVLYGHPSGELIVIGVTGTSGKTTTSYFMAHALEADGAKSGSTSTALFKVADREWVNDTKMTMLGRFQLQKLLRKMVDAGCTYAVIETSSQGIIQHRHKEIAYDACVFTKLTPEHIEAHGGFENYKQAKIELFRHTASLPRKQIKGKQVPRFAILNRDDEHAKDFAMPGFDRIVWFGEQENADVRASNIRTDANGTRFAIQGTEVFMATPGRVMAMNALAAIATAEAFGIAREKIAKRLAELPPMPGRFERIDEGQAFTVIVDYGFEPAALGHLFDFADTLKGTGHIIHVTGSTGGGRDVARRGIVGRLSAKRSDVTIVTNEDPYDEDPRRIIDDVANGALAGGKIEDATLFRINDRKTAIQRAIEIAKPGDVVLITGKGSEPVMAVAHGRKIPWDDRIEVRAAIRGKTIPLK